MSRELNGKYEDKLEWVEGKRFETVEDLKYELKCADIQTSNAELEPDMDWQLSGTYGEIDGVHYDFEVYFAKTRAGDMFITGTELNES